VRNLQPTRVSGWEPVHTIYAYAYAVVYSSVGLYDKRREPCYQRIPIAQYLHVSSALSSRTGPNVLLGQLHRFTSIIMDRDNFLTETARAVRGLLDRGFHHAPLFKVLKRFLHVRFYWYGDNHGEPVFRDVVRRVGAL